MTQIAPPGQTPSRRFGLGTVGAAVAFGLAVGLGGAWLLGRPARESGRATAKEETKATYTCPMHPTIVFDHPGNCPICEMPLVRAHVSGAAGEKGASSGRAVAFYRSPMDPKKTSPIPKKDEMGMDYVPVYVDEVLAGGTPVEGLATVSIDPQRQQLIGLRTVEVQWGPVNSNWRTVGRVAVDETRVHHVNVKVGGFVGNVFADYVGKHVSAGDPLFTIYSPELVSTQEEYLLALNTRAALHGSGPVNDEAGQDLVTSARKRLENWDVPESEIQRLERTGTPTKMVTLYSPMTGVVTKKDISMGHHLNEGDMPYEVTDLSRVWVLADAYEADLSRIRLGTKATFALEALPNRVFTGKVIFVDPILDPKTRTAKVRLEFANPKGELKPEMFGEVTLQTPSREGLRIPADAVIDSGTTKVVFLAVGAGKFQPREVRLGSKNGDSMEVLSGLEAGERVVTHANFLVDSESRLRASIAALSAK